jgi:hypothetical protein
VGRGAAQGDLSRLLGADVPPAPPVEVQVAAADARFQLIGVVSPRAAQAGHEGLALIAVDGKPARALRVGAVVDGRNVLQAVGAGSATLGPRDGAAWVVLSLAPPAGAQPLRSLATARPRAQLTEEQLFVQRQQQQFQEEQMQNQGPYPASPLPLSNGPAQAEPGKPR